MTERIIVDSDLIRSIINKEAFYMRIKYNKKRAFYKTDRMSKFAMIDIERVVNL